MQSLYGRRARDQTLTKALALRQAQLALLNGEIGGPTPAAGADQPCGRSRRPISLSGDAPDPNPRGPDNACRWTHPYYWAPFVLMGNWL
jgi:CHAT domain-containing protein